MSTGGHNEQENTLNQLLVEMDGNAIAKEPMNQFLVLFLIQVSIPLKASL